jgi:hypothetical protein
MVYLNQKSWPLGLGPEPSILVNLGRSTVLLKYPVSWLCKLAVHHKEAVQAAVSSTKAILSASQQQGSLKDLTWLGIRLPSKLREGKGRAGRQGEGRGGKLVEGKLACKQ